MFRRAELLLTTLLLAGCATSDRIPGPETPLLQGLEALGQASLHPGSGEMVVVLIRDRHAIHGAITRTRGRLWHVQRENHAAIAFLSAKGFRLMGCEAALGPLPEGDVAQAHRAAVLKALQEGDDLDRLTVYQPIRYAVQYAASLEVVGVEDPELYASDTRALAEIVEINRTLRRADADPGVVRSMSARRSTLLQEVRANAFRRGEASGRNLLELMKERQVQRAFVLMGGAHVPALQSSLQQAGVTCIVFECASYDA